MQDVLNKTMSPFDEVSFCVILKSNIYDIESISLRVHKQMLLHAIFSSLFYGMIPIINNKINNSNNTLPYILKCWVRPTKDKAIQQLITTCISTNTVIRDPEEKRGSHDVFSVNSNDMYISL